MVRVNSVMIGAGASALALALALYYIFARRSRPTPAALPEAKPHVEPKAEPKTETKALTPATPPPQATRQPAPAPGAEEAAAKSEKKKKKSKITAENAASGGYAPLPSLAFEEDGAVDPTRVGVDRVDAPADIAAPIKVILLDTEAAVDEPTASAAMILVSATARTDVGLRRKRNEDAILEMPVEGVFVVADGMGGYRGGDIASSLAVRTIARAFEREEFDSPPHEGVPRRASELARAIQMANVAILAKAQEDKELEGMGTTVCAARFAANKQRLYIGHVGDSRMYRFRNGALKRLTKDHTMKDLGVEGAAAAHLSRAVGIWPVVPVDLIFCKPLLNDVYLLCSDGLTKMLNDEAISAVIKSGDPPARLVRSLVDAANASGGKDNISVIIIRVQDVGAMEPS